MTEPSNPEVLAEIEREVRAFLASLARPVLSEDSVDCFDLASSEWRLEVRFNKLIFEVGDSNRSITRRLEGIAYRRSGRLGINARKPGSQGMTVLEFRDLGSPLAEPSEPVDRASLRAEFERDLVGALKSHFAGWEFERVSHRSDREHSFSTWYTRGLARQGRAGWAFLGLNNSEDPAAADSALSYGLIWLDWLRRHPNAPRIEGLKLFLPPEAAALSAHRAVYLDRRAAEVEIYEWPSSHGLLRALDLADFGNVETRLVRRSQREAVLERHGGLLSRLLGDLAPKVDAVPDAGGDAVSLRVRGLEVARVEGSLQPRVSFGLEGDRRRWEGGDPGELRALLARALEIRRARSHEPAHEFYRLQSERWLESLLMRDLTRVDPALSREHVYPQVPAFSGSAPASASGGVSRGVIDILGVTKGSHEAPGNRLAVIELKVQEEINLPMQGLDYWLRVKWLQQRKQFREFGYFPGLELSDAPPLLYLVSPAFRFHSTTSAIARYLSPGVEVIQVGLNDGWRGKVRVLFRRRLPETLSGSLAG